jgi:hypothetical protein
MDDQFTDCPYREMSSSRASCHTALASLGVLLSAAAAIAATLRHILLESVSVAAWADNAAQGRCALSYRTQQQLRPADSTPIVDVMLNDGATGPLMAPSNARWGDAGNADSSDWRTSDALLCIGGRILGSAQVQHLHIRGHDSRLFPKKQFALKIIVPPSLGGATILGLRADGNRSEFVLSNSYVDKTSMRNPIGYQIYRQLGGWATDSVPINLLINGTDFGLYYLGEKITLARFDTSRRRARPSEGLLYVDNLEKVSRFPLLTTNVTYTPFFLRERKESAIALPSRALSLLNSLDSALSPAATAAGLPPSSIDALVDVESFARFFVFEELAKDWDGYGCA